MSKIKNKQEELLEFAKKRIQWRNDPIGFFKEVLGMKLPYHQKKMLQECYKRNRIAIRSANALGKCGFFEDYAVLSDGTLVKNKDLIGKEFTILSYDPITKQQCGKKARAIDNGIKECLEIQTQSGKIVTRTVNHPLYKGVKTLKYFTVNGQRKTRLIKDEGWTPANELKVGDYILTPISHENITPTKLDFTDEECKMLGYLIGDGGTTIGVYFTQEDNKQLEDFIQCAKTLGSGITTLKNYGYKVVGDGHKGGNPVLNKVKEWGLFGCKSTEKLLPDFVGQLPLRQIALILNRIYACDGYATSKITKKRNQPDNWKNLGAECRIGITLANLDLIKQIRLLLMRFGIETWFRHRTVSYTGSDKKFDAWELTIIKRDSVKLFCEKIGIYGKEEAVDKCLKTLEQFDGKRTQKYIYENCPEGFRWEEIKHIKNVGDKPTVCIEVDDTHTYLTEVYDHNSHCVAALAFHFFFTRVSDDPNDTTIVLITAPTFAQIKDSIFANIKMFADEADNYIKQRFGEQASFLPKDFSESANVCEYRYNPKCFITGIATGEGAGGSGNKFSSRHASRVLVIADESQGVSEGTFSAIEGILSGGQETKYILLGNTTLPNGASGTYYDSFQENSTFSPLKITAFDSPNFTEPGITLEDMLANEKEPNNWRKKLDKYCGTNYKNAVLNDEVDLWENEVKKHLPLAVITNPISVYRILERCGFNPDQYEFKTRVLAEFPTGGGRMVIDSQMLDASFNNYSNPECFEDDGVTAMGVDISAGLGRDFSTIAIRRGNKIIYLEEFQLKAPEFEQKIRELYQEYSCNYCNLERDGVGAIVYEHLLEYNDIFINTIVSGGAPGIPEPMDSIEEEMNEQYKKEYHRQRDFLWFNLANLMSPYYCNKHGGKPILLPRNNKLKKQLLSATWKKSSTNKTQVESKEEIRKKLGTSTDLADAVLFAFAPVGDVCNMQLMDCTIFTYKNTSWN